MSGVVSLRSGCSVQPCATLGEGDWCGRRLAPGRICNSLLREREIEHRPLTQPCRFLHASLQAQGFNIIPKAA